MYADFVTISVFLINLILLSSSRIAACIRLMAIQGVLVALTPFIVPSHDNGNHGCPDQLAQRMCKVVPAV